jgi:cysteine synthase
MTAAADSLDRYYSIVAMMQKKHGKLDEAAACGRIEGVFHAAKTDYVQHATSNIHQRWHNLKYYTWVEQQGKTVKELDAQRDPAWWVEHQNMVAEIDERLAAARKEG